MTHNIEEQLLILSADELRELRQRDGDDVQLDADLRDAAELCLQSHASLASSLAADHPGTPTSVLLARHRRRWHWHVLLWGVFLPLGVLALALLATTVAALVTAFFWRP
jgi:hypothetical protein